MRHAQRAALGFGATLLLATAITALSIFGLRSVLRSEAEAREHALSLARAERLRFFFEQKVASSRGYFVTGQHRFLADADSESGKFDSALAALNYELKTTEGRQLLSQIARGKARHDSAFRQAIAARTATPSTVDEIAIFLGRMKPIRDNVDIAFEQLEAFKARLAVREHAEAQRASRNWSRGIAVTSVFLLLVGLGLAIYLSRSIRQHEQIERNFGTEMLAQSRDLERVIGELRAENARLKKDAGRKP